MHRLTTPVVIAASCATIAACGPRQSHEPPPSPTAAVNAWATWPRMNPKRLWSRAHARTFVDVHVAPAFADAYRQDTDPMPVGSTIVKAIYPSAEAATPLRLTVMVKMKPGFDPDDADWYYAVMSADGATQKAGGRIGMCIDCHIMSDADDYLYRPKGGGTWRDAFPGPQSSDARPDND